MAQGKWWAVVVPLAVLLTPAAALAGDGTFTEAPGSPYNSPNDGPDSTAVGDFNNDNHQDLVVGRFNSGVTLLLGAGDGTFTSAAGPAVPGTSLRGVAVADFNNDGNDDIAVADDSADVTVFPGDGAGGFGLPQVLLTSFGTGLAVADFNGNGSEDVLANELIAPGARFFPGNGGTFGPPVPVDTADGATQSAIADFNGDGNLDLATDGGPPKVLLGLGNGTFPTEVALPPPGVSGATSVGTGDFNLDGRADLVFGISNSSAYRVMLGNATGFVASTQFTAGDNPSALAQASLAIGDFNSDGREDIVTESPSFSTYSVFLGNGDGTFPPIASFPPTPTGAQPRHITVGDFNEDGSDDLALGSNSGISILLGNGSGPLAGNLLTNGGFEGAAVRQPFDPAPPAIAGWERTGSATAARYGMSNSSLFPSRISAPRFNGGSNYLFGGTGPGDATAFQMADVAASAASIDAGLATARLSAHLGGGNIFEDTISATASFLDGSGGELGSFAVGPVTRADRNTQSTLLPRSGSAAVPAGTRQIRVTMNATNAVGGGIFAFADNVKLTLDAPPPPENPPPDTGVVVELSAKKAQKIVRQRGVVVTASCPQEACSAVATGRGNVRKPPASRDPLVKLRPRAVTRELAAGVPQRIKLKLRKPQLRLVRAALATGKRPKLRVTATATDAVGNTATQTVVVRARR